MYQLILREGLAPVVVGGSIGMVVALLLTRLMKTLLFEVSPYDPATACLAAVILLLVSFVACILPARSAALHEPTQTLRVG